MQVTNYIYLIDGKHLEMFQYFFILVPKVGQGKDVMRVR